MSLLQHLEDEAEHLLEVVKHMLEVQRNATGVVSEATQKIHDALEAHLATPISVEVIVSTPVQHTEEPDHVEPELTVVSDKT
jgi:type IV secretory pathway VirB4 component